MFEFLMLIPRAALLFGGAAIGVVTALLRGKESSRRSPIIQPGSGSELSRVVHSTQPVQTVATSRVARDVSVQYATLNKRIASLEAMVERHDAKLREVPSIEQIMDAMDQVFERGAVALHARFAEQTRAIENLQTVVSQTDELLEKVLDSIYALQTESSLDPPPLTH